jgi:replicative DNA helicase
VIEQVIIKQMILDEPYTRKVLPFLEDKYFVEDPERVLFKAIKKYVESYNKCPDKTALAIEVDATSGLSDDTVRAVHNLLESFDDKPSDSEWAADQTEKYCQDRAIYLAITDSIKILDDKSGKIDRGAIPSILQDALSISFDTDLGHDYLRDAEERFDYYHSKQERIPFGIDMLNKATNGGLPRKTLSILLAGTGVGKSAAMCSFASDNLMRGYNVLYITLEMAKQRIAERIDANLLNINVDELSMLPRDVYMKKINRVREKTTGRLIVEEYPTSTGNVNHFRHLLNELKTKENFTPDIIYVDYINICASSRVKLGANVNSYTYIKNIAEELRGLAVEYNVPIVSATQTTRSGFSNMDSGLEDTAESFGLPHTADWMCLIACDESLEQLQQLLFKQLKSRLGDISKYRRFMVGFERLKFRLYDVEQLANETLMERPTPSSNRSGERGAFDDFR